MNETLEQAIQEEPTMTCPTCLAEQPWSDQCRRCKSDLTELRVAWRSGQQAKAACLLALRNGHFDRALHFARRLVSYNPDEEALRLVAICHLFRGEWSQAMSFALQQGSESKARC